MISLDKEALKVCLSCIDLTTLNATDTLFKGRAFANNVNNFTSDFPEMPSVAAICVYPALVPAVRAELTVPNVKIAAVGAGFPTSQTFEEVKSLECALCVERGADEIDIVISLNYFLSEDFDQVAHEIQSVRTAIDNAAAAQQRQVHLKVILESGTLESENAISQASFIAMENGADFIKTSTGKSEPAATPEAARVMCQCIKDYHTSTGKKVGFKAAGGIVTTQDALTYYGIVRDILGPEWLNPSLFRIGASRLANNLLSELRDRPIKYF